MGQAPRAGLLYAVKAEKSRGASAGFRATSHPEAEKSRKVRAANYTGPAIGERPINDYYLA